MKTENGLGRHPGALGLGLGVLLLAACADITAVGDAGSRIGKAEGAHEGAISLNIVLGRVSALGKASAALAKKADTVVALDTLYLRLTSPGCATREVALPLSGDIHSAPGQVAARLEGLASLRNWTVKAWSKDADDSVMHIDSTTFYVRPGDTSMVDLNLRPAYSVLVARFFSNNRKTTGIRKLELIVAGVVVDDTTFSTNRPEFDVRLSHKYLRAGAASEVELRAYNTAKNVKYFRAFSLNPAASMDSEVNVQLTQDGG